MPPLEDIVYRSSLLDADNLPIATGTVRFDKSKNCGRFWPQTEQNSNSLIARAKKVQTEDGTVFEIENIRHLKAEFPNSGGYFEFDY
jgi:hypothetical protein